jgi:hypothetical protein
MSVDDIQYLYENSEKDNFILYVDSASRNQTFFPKPSQYTITFEQPFKFVYGIDILDASIPATMYNIEEDDNDVNLFTYLLNPSASNSSGTSYDLQSMLYELSEIEEFDKLMNSKTIARVVTGSAGAESRKTGEVFVTNDALLDQFPRYVNNNRQFYGLNDNPYYYVFVRTAITDLPIFRTSDKRAFTYQIYNFIYNNEAFQLERPPGDQNVENFISAFENTEFRFVLTRKQNELYDAIFYRVQSITEQELVIMRSDATTPIYMINIQFYYITFTPGNYGATSFVDEGKKAFGGTDIEIAGQSSGDISIRPRLTFTSSIEFVLNMQISSARTSLGFDEYAVTTMPTLYKQVFYKENRRLFAANIFGSRYRVIAPGVIYLLGTRYVILRCPEIEGHMYASRAFGQFSPGIGMFKMYAVNDIAHQRFDFVNFHKKPFHPIGKLDRMTLRFERPDGRIYDFKGANHLLLICIKYLVPSQKQKFGRSVLNPNYEYDFNKYLHRKIEYKESSDDEDEGLEEITNKYNSSAFRVKYNKLEQQYDFSSSEDEDDITSKMMSYPQKNKDTSYKSNLQSTTNQNLTTYIISSESDDSEEEI